MYKKLMRFWLFHVAAIDAFLLLPNALAQEAETSVERVVVAAPELGPTNASAVNPDVLGLTGDFRKIDAVMPNVSINDAGDDSFQDVYAVRGLNNTPNFSKQALTVYIDDVPSVSTFTNFTDLGALQSWPARRSGRQKRRGWFAGHSHYRTRRDSADHRLRGESKLRLLERKRARDWACHSEHTLCENRRWILEPRRVPGQYFPRYAPGFSAARIWPTAIPPHANTRMGNQLQQ